MKMYLIAPMIALVCLTGCGSGNKSATTESGGDTGVSSGGTGAITGNEKASWGMTPEQVAQALGNHVIPDITEGQVGTYTLLFCDMRTDLRSSDWRAAAYVFENGKLVAVREDYMYPGAGRAMVSELEVKFGDKPSISPGTLRWTRPDGSEVKADVAKIGMLDSACIVYRAPRTDLASIQGDDVRKRQITALSEAKYQAMKAMALEAINDGTQEKNRAVRLVIRQFGVDLDSEMAARLMKDLGLPANGRRNP